MERIFCVKRTQLNSSICCYKIINISHPRHPLYLLPDMNTVTPSDDRLNPPLSPPLLGLLSIGESGYEGKSYHRPFNNSLFVKKVATSNFSSTTTPSPPLLTPSTSTTVAKVSCSSSKDEATPLGVVVVTSQSPQKPKYRPTVSGTRSNKASSSSVQVTRYPLLLAEVTMGSDTSNSRVFPENIDSDYSNNSLLSKLSPNRSPVSSTAKHYPSNLKGMNNSFLTPFLPVAFPPRTLSFRQRPRPNPKIVSRQLSSDA